MLDALGAAILAVLLLGGSPTHAQEVPPASDARVAGPQGSEPFWHEVRSGEQGYVSIPDKKAGTLVQSGGESWRAFRNGPYRTWSGYVLLGAVALLSLFFALRGRIRIERGRSGYVIERFNLLERFTHWLTATCFIVLALTGLNIAFGRYLLLPLIGKDAHAALAMWGKVAHDFTGFGFMAGIALMFVLWAWQNIPTGRDVVWLMKGGGMIGHAHPSAGKFNAGQKIIFWLVVLIGLSLSLSGLQLLFPFTFHFFEHTFAALNLLGLGLPTDLSPMQEQQLATLWHGAMAVLLTAAIFAHVYIGTIGMEGAFEAMGKGTVDLNWAREHHDLWVEEMERRDKVQMPAE
jgi:formate dehydrogenase subunit gamma